jgi:sulfhydrogenase subunit beta (sulfur reductase)
VIFAARRYHASEPVQHGWLAPLRQYFGLCLYIRNRGFIPLAREPLGCSQVTTGGRECAVSQSVPARIAPDQVETLIQSLQRRGYEVLGPTIRDGAIVYDHIEGLRDLPQGWTDRQEAGFYRLEKRPDRALFGYAVGPQSWKKYLHPAQIKLFEAERRNGLFQIHNQPARPPRPYAFIGVRACELAAIAIQDRVLLDDRYRDPIYQARRGQAFLVAVQCAQAAPTCFCASMGTGPHVAAAAADLTLTEVAGPVEHWLLVEAGTDRGREVLAELEHRPATEQDCRSANAAVDAAAAQQTRHMETEDIRDLLYQNFEHPRWDNVAERCLTCANCTMVCPTCFCTTVEDVTDVTGDHAERWRRWDSCFTMNFSYIHGGSVRTTSRARYRQWMTHKLASWIDQFGSSGCVGCGRCITWCPVGIDITEEVQAIRGGVDHGNTHT